MKNREKRNLLAISAQFRKAGSHKDEVKDVKLNRKKNRDLEKQALQNYEKPNNGIHT